MRILFLVIVGVGIFISPAKAFIFPPSEGEGNNLNLPILPRGNSSNEDDSGILNLNAIFNNNNNGVGQDNRRSSDSPWSIPLPGYTPAAITGPKTFDPRFSSILANTTSQNTLLNMALTSPYAATKSWAIPQLDKPHLTTFLQISAQPVWNEPFRLDNLPEIVVGNIASSFSGLELKALLNNPYIPVPVIGTILKSPQTRNKLASLEDIGGNDTKESTEENQAYDFTAYSYKSYKDKERRSLEASDNRAEEEDISSSSYVSVDEYLLLGNTSENLVKLVKEFRNNNLGSHNLESHNLESHNDVNDVNADKHDETIGLREGEAKKEVRRNLDKHSEDGPGKNSKKETNKEEPKSLASETLNTTPQPGDNSAKNESVQKEVVKVQNSLGNYDSGKDLDQDLFINEIKQAQRASQKRLLEAIGGLKVPPASGKIQAIAIYEKELEILQYNLDRIIKESKPQASFNIEFKDGFSFKFFKLPETEKNNEGVSQK